MRKALYSIEGEALRDWLIQGRQDADLTMRSLADKLDLPFQTIGKIENGERRLDVVEYVAYCRALGLDPHKGIKLLLKKRRYR